MKKQANRRHEDLSKTTIRVLCAIGANVLNDEDLAIDFLEDRVDLLAAISRSDNDIPEALTDK